MLATPIPMIAPPSSSGRQGHGVFTRIGDRHLANAEASDVLGRVDATSARQILQVERAARQRHGERLDADGHLHLFPSSLKLS